jgi:hypothetical protein
MYMNCDVNQARTVSHQDGKFSRVHTYLCGVRTTIPICVAQSSVVQLRDEASPCDKVP